MNLDDANIPRPEYPRPQFVRLDWLNLNGVWEFAFDDLDAGVPLGWPLGLPLEHRIIVPFPYQSESTTKRSTRLFGTRAILRFPQAGKE
jgi:beta-galactosidase/beta-glucuronidase